MDYSPPGSSVYGILQARILEWTAIPFSRGFLDPGIEPVSPALAGDFFTTKPQGSPRTLWGGGRLCKISKGREFHVEDRAFQGSQKENSMAVSRVRNKASVAVAECAKGREVRRGRLMEGSIYRSWQGSWFHSECIKSFKKKATWFSLHFLKDHSGCCAENKLQSSRRRSRETC